MTVVVLTVLLPLHGLRLAVAVVVAVVAVAAALVAVDAAVATVVAAVVVAAVVAAVAAAVELVGVDDLIFVIGVSTFSSRGRSRVWTFCGRG